MDELIARTQTQISGQNEGLVALTFDDGLRNHGEVAYPILKRLRVPATFYLCADLLDKPGSIWTWEIYSRLGRLKEVDQKRFLNQAGVYCDLEGIVHWMKTIPVARREQIEKEIHDLTPEFQFTPSERDSFELMSWKTIQNLDPDLITIGSHTATHIDLPQAEPERLVRELSLGKESLELRLGRKIEHFAYPNGNFNERVLPVVKKYYASAVTTNPGVVKQGDNPLLLNRIHAEFDLPRFSWELAANASRERRA
jgi:peptidoglycan/xylan/chitin deacetylase (PgdA/CDA1 family)